MRSSLPDKSNWRFDAIVECDHERASALALAPSSDALLKAVVTKFESALKSEDVRIGRERATQERQDRRVVVQFYVGAALYDLFFNARTGYRAHFRAHYECGLDFNSDLIEALRSQMEARLPNIVRGREFDFGFQNCGDAKIPKQFVMDSLVPDLSKVWRCDARIRPSGGVDELPPGVMGPKIVLLDDGSQTWSAFYRDDADAWLDIKGAFLKPTGEPYPSNDLIERAKRLHHTGAT
jgi:hypothetical protein